MINLTENNQNATSKDEQIGYHKGSLTTLSKEREELARLLNIVDHLINMHSSQLKELGVSVESQVKTQDEQNPPKKKRPIEDIL